MKRLFVILMLALLGGCASLPQGGSAGGVLEVVKLHGEVNEEAVTKMHAEVDRIVADSDVKAVLVMVDSGGGGVYASAELYDELARIAVPVVAYCESMCASGAVYAIMSPSVKAIALGQQTIMGSIGVIRVIQRQDVPDNIRIIKSGKYKQAGSVSPAQPGEDEYLDRQIGEAASIFYGVVDKARGSKITADAWVHIKNAEMFFGRYAVAMGLADVVTSKHDVLAYAMLFAHADLTPRYAK